ncbi:MAG: nucleotidyltransferase domain-containing protein [Longicatena sp.]|nr:nucleotidyltransferase domain-containing protein [Longicatena sp.]
MEVEQILKEIEKVCKKNNVNKLILFGSFAKSTYYDTSDIDIAVAGNFNYWDLIDNLESIETLRSIDVVDLNDLKNEHLWEDINKYGRILYQ